MNTIKNLDIFGNKFQLNLNGANSYKTFIGGMATIFLAFSSLILSWYFGQDIYLKKTLNLVQVMRIEIVHHYSV